MRLAFWLPAATAPLLLAACALAPGTPSEPSPITARERQLATALHAAADSLLARVDADGRFVYRVSASGHVHDGYNVLRHAGTLWALQDYHRDHPSPELAAALDRASRWLETCCLKPLPRRWPFAAIWSVPEGEPDEAKLGGAGLALAAWQGLAAQGLYAPDAARLQATARFIVYLQKPDGSFHSKYRDGARRDRWVSLYYPGEAALGLLAQHRADGDPLWHEAAVRALLYLADSRADSGDYPDDHWALIASAELARIDGGISASLREHTEVIARQLLVRQDADGDFAGRRRAAPAATRLEALGAALQVVEEPSTRAAIHTAMARGAAFLMHLQTRDGPYPGALRRGAVEASDRRHDELRIDDTQHVLSVWLAQCRLQKYTCTRP